MNGWTMGTAALVLLTSSGLPGVALGTESRGSISMDEAHAVMATRIHEIEACVEPATVLYPALEIEIIVEVLVEPDGTVRSVQEGKSSMEDTRLGQCLCDVFRTAQFPANEMGDTPVRIPFKVLGPSHEATPAAHTPSLTQHQAHDLLQRYTDTLELFRRDGCRGEVVQSYLDGQLADARSQHEAGTLTDEFYDRHRELLVITRLYFAPDSAAGDRVVVARLQAFTEGSQGVPEFGVGENLAPDVVLPVLLAEALTSHMEVDGTSDRKAACTRYFPGWDIVDGACLPRAPDRTGEE